ncbi:MAG: hypothetical protein NTX08_11230 [Sphingobacteriales bacterium]|nr:hypothetical protein [Sphingobacteriales bacterium]
MRKFICATTVALLLSISANACEICGCGLGSYYIGMMPQFSHKFIGLRYQYRRFHTVMADDASSNDYYKTTELWAGWNIGKKWQLIAILPYNFVHQVSDDGVTNNQGIGDIAVMANYKLFDLNSNRNGRAFAQQLWFGAGIKVPTGKFNVDATDPALVAVANTQTGSASTDFMLNAMYNVRINKLGINTSASYKINTSNRDKYSFGNKFSAGSMVYYAAKKGAVGIMPNMGLMFENTASNSLQKVTVAQTGGHLFSASAGLELSYKKLTVGASVQLPLSQNFSNGQTELKSKGMLHVTFSL